jgi:predicted RecB family nuclease
MRKRYPPQSLTDVPGVGKSVANDLRNIGIQTIDDLKGIDPEQLYELSNQYAGKIQDRCLLYVFRCAVYFAETQEQIQEPEKLNWWYWKDRGWARTR